MPIHNQFNHLHYIFTMKKALYFLSIVLFSANLLPAQTVEVTSWIINTTNYLGHNNIPADVQEVWYNNSNVFIHVTDVPAYNVGPWPGNPNDVADQDDTYRITRSPEKKKGTKVAVGLGEIGLWINGVFIYGAEDGRSWQNQGVWHQDAYVSEGSTFDNCFGHPDQSDAYHHHSSPKCLYDETATTTHSPIIGWAFDGFPIYGAYGYARRNGTGGIIRMESGYELRNLTSRTNGPSLTQAPLGTYIEDYEYTGNGDLDEYNGRFTVTPEYPGGIYAYFVTIDANYDPVYPYIIGPSYYGKVATGNTSGGFTIPNNATQYLPGSAKVDMGDFDVEVVEAGVSVQWSTNHEIDHDRFIVEKTRDFTHWEVTEIIEGEGDTEWIKDYESVDATPYRGESHYRVRQMDKNGELRSTQTRSIYFDGLQENVRLLGNLVAQGNAIRLEVDFAQADIQLYNLQGQALFTETVTGRQVEIPTHNLAHGTYIVAVRAEGSRWSNTVTVSK